MGLSLSLWFLACGSSVQSAQRLTAEENGKTVDLRVGEELEVVLTANPSTGYDWEIAALDQNVLKLEGDARYESGADMPGAPGKDIFRFQAEAAGQTALRLVYRRSWETGVAPEGTFEITVRVR